MNTHAQEAARLVWAHWSAGTKLDELPAALRPADLAAGHAVQAQLPAAAGRQVLGWKIAATSSAGQAHIGVSGPLAGRLLAGQVHEEGSPLSLAGNGMRVAEPEFVFRLGRDLPPRAAPYVLAEVMDAVDALHTGLEVPDSRFGDFVRAGHAQLLADNACAHQFVLGPAAAPAWRGLDLRSHRVHARVSHADGSATVREGSGEAVLGDPRAALLWLVNELRSLGLTLAAGQCVTTGTCMTPLALQAGDRVQADFGVLGQVGARFVA